MSSVGDERKNSGNNTSTAIVSNAAATQQAQMALLTAQIQILLSLIFALFILFVFCVLPYSAQITLLAFILSSTLLSQALYQYLQLFYQRQSQRIQDLIRQNGIVHYLPSSIQPYFNSMTFHEFMSDTSFVDEYRFMMIYVIPGLTPEQRLALIERLPERRRRMLLGRGFAREMLFGENDVMDRYLFGENVIIGNNGNLMIEQEQQEEIQVEAIDAVEPSPSSPQVTTRQALMGIWQNIAGDHSTNNNAHVSASENNVSAAPQQTVGLPPTDLIWSDENSDDDIHHPHTLLTSNHDQSTTSSIATSSIPVSRSTTPSPGSPLNEERPLSSSTPAGSRAITATPRPSRQEEHQQDNSVISTAISTAISTITTSFTTSVEQIMDSTFNTLQPLLLQGGILSGAAFVGIRYWPNFMNRFGYSGERRGGGGGSVSPTTTRFGMVLGMGSIVMGLSAGALMLIRPRVKRALEAEREKKKKGSLYF